MDSFPRPFGHVRDNYGDGHIFQHEPFSEREMLTCSTMPVYSGAQMREAEESARKQALKDAVAACDKRIPVKCSTSMVDVSRNQGIRACIDAIYALEPITPEFRATVLALASEQGEGDGLGRHAT